MEGIHTIGLDIAKHAFQVHGATASGEVVLKKKLKRQQVLELFSYCLAARWQWRLAAEAIIGDERSSG